LCADVDKQKVIVIPEIVEIPIDARDQFIVLASDGVWKVMGNDELCEFINEQLTKTTDAFEICNAIVDTCYMRVFFLICFVDVCFSMLLTFRSAKTTSPLHCFLLERMRKSP
jgi:hypothetical protein